eukprot:826818-Alexandrium_andersonii.AAC.1
MRARRCSFRQFPMFEVRSQAQARPHPCDSVMGDPGRALLSSGALPIGCPTRAPAPSALQT